MARAPKTTAPQRNSLAPFYAILGVVALGGVGAIAYQMLGGGGDAATEPLPAVALDASELQSVQGIALGPENAPVTIYEFADFQCPACGQYASFVTPLIKDRLVGSGNVRYVYYDFPLAMHPHAFLASRAGRCAHEQGKFWEYHDLLYARQPTWSALGNATDYFVDLGDEVPGLDTGQFGSCVLSDKYADVVTQNMRLGEALNVNGTPTLFVNMKQLPTPPPFSALEAIVQQEMAGFAPAAAPADSAPADSAAAGA